MIADLTKVSWLSEALMLGRHILVNGRKATVLSVERVDSPDLTTQTVATHFEAVVLVPTNEGPVRGRIVVSAEGAITVPAETVAAMRAGDNA